MPCICYGAVSGDEQLDKHLQTENGRETLLCLRAIASQIKLANIDIECDRREFNRAFVTMFSHLLNGCPEQHK